MKISDHVWPYMSTGSIDSTLSDILWKETDIDVWEEVWDSTYEIIGTNLFHAPLNFIANYELS